MKANRKFLLKNDDDAVSPVIAVILMVAITVVLAATVYVWVSGFGGSSTTPAKTIALTSAGQIDDDCATDAECKSYTVAGASPGLKYEDLDARVDGTEYTFGTTCTPASNSTWSACAGTTTRASTDLVSAGDKITIRLGANSGLSGKDFLVLDADSNSVIYSVTVS